MRKQIRQNRGRCRLCDTVIESEHRHDFKWCPCASFFVDGGKDYLRRGMAQGLTLDDYEELSEYEEGG